MMPLALTGDPCVFAPAALISLQLAERLHRGARALAAVGLGELLLISGYRSVEEQLALLDDPDAHAAPVDRSTHTTCPATGADVWLPAWTDGPESDGLKTAVGLTMEAQGLRWGGGSATLPNGLPLDFNHFDLGPRP